MRVRVLLVLALTLAGFSAFASGAGAATFCLGADPLCSGNPGNIYPMTEDGLIGAVSVANGNSQDDVIEIGAGTIDIDTTIIVNSPVGNGLLIEGVGNGNTNLHFTQATGAGLLIDATGFPNDSVKDLNVKIDGPVSGSRQALSLLGGAVVGVNFDVTSSGGAASYGLRMSGGTKCTYCTFDLSGSSASGVYAPGNATILSSRFSDASGAVDATRGVVLGSPATVNVKNSQFIALDSAVNFDGGAINIFDSIIDMRDHVDAEGLYVSNDNPSTSTLAANLDGVSIVGAGDGQRGLVVEAETDKPGGETATATLTNSLIMLTGALTSEIRCADDGNFGVATVNMTWVFAHDSTPNAALGCTINKSAEIDSDAYGPNDVFVNWGTGDLRPKKGSPVIDAGNVNTVATGRGFDAIGGNRFFDGLGSGGDPVIDAGGIEYQDYPPDKPTVGASATTVEVGTAIDFTASSIDGNGDPVTYSWDFSDGSVSSEQNPTHTFTKDGSYVVQAWAHAGGSTSEVGEIEITVNAKAKTDCCSVGAGYTNNFVYNKFSGPLRPPKSGRLKNGFAVSATKPKRGGFIRITTNAKMAVKLSIEKPKGGYLVSGACRAKQGKTGSAKRCTLPLKGTQTLELPAGTSYLTFGGKWNKKALPSGKYTLIGVDPDPAAPTTQHKLAVTYTAKQGKTGKTK